MGLSVTLEGRLVRLEPLRAWHEEPLWAAAQDGRTWRYMRVRGGESRLAFRGWFEAALTDLPFAVLLSGEAVGSTSYLNVRPHDRVVEIGNTWLSPRAWGTGANDEAKLLLMEQAFEREGFLRVEFKTEAANERSRAALLAIGATFEGIFRKHMLVRGGERRDSAWYAVIDEDWPAVKAALQTRLAARARAFGPRAGP
ncbi:MAG: GNAT family N-acetyltransferase [Gaiellaceae bacterium]